jgi:hypothetical protein
MTPAGAVVGVLHQHGVARTIEQSAHQQAHGKAGHPRPQCLRRESKAEPRHGMQFHNGQADAGERADDRRLYADVMHQVRPEPLIEPADFAENANEIVRPGTAAPPVQRMQLETVAFDRRAAVHHIGRDVDVVTGAQRGAGHRQAMRQEVPVLGHQINQHRLNRLIGARHEGRSH